MFRYTKPFITNCRSILWSALLISLFFPSDIVEADLTIGNGIVLDLNRSELSMECTDLTVQNGGLLTLNSGKILNCRNITLESGALLFDTDGTLLFNGTWENNASFVQSLYSIIRAETGCGVENRVAGTGDTDGDAIPDYWEFNRRLNPFGKDSGKDPDYDSLSNLDEYLNNTDPFNPDTDGDGFSDGAEVYHGSNPLDKTDQLPEGRIIYVRQEADGATNGKTWEDAFSDLETALDNAMTGDRIWVAAGIYYPNTEGVTDPRDASFRLISGVEIYGGFNGTEILQEERDILLNRTILSGDIGIKGDISDNTYHVIFSPEGAVPDETARLDGFVISDGNADGEAAANCGGGIYNNSSPTLSNLVFINNYAGYGGGIYATGSGSVISQSEFTENRAMKDGGGIYSISSNISTENCLFRKNQAIGNGGGIYQNNSNPTHTGDIFSENRAEFGGAIAGINSEPVIIDSEFRQNNALQSGGGIHGDLSTVSVRTSIFESNRADRSGGAINMKASSLSLQNALLYKNTGAALGGGLNGDSSTIQVFGSTFYQNTCRINGGAVYITAFDIEIHGSILWENSPNDLVTLSPEKTVEYSVVTEGHTGNGNIDADPIFASPETGDFTPLPRSPCIGAGDPEADEARYGQTDVMGFPRWACGGIDIGACELPEPICDLQQAGADGQPNNGDCFIRSL